MATLGGSNRNFGEKEKFPKSKIAPELYNVGGDKTVSSKASGLGMNKHGSACGATKGRPVRNVCRLVISRTVLSVCHKIRHFRKKFPYYSVLVLSVMRGLCRVNSSPILEFGWKKTNYVIDGVSGRENHILLLLSLNLYFSSHTFFIKALWPSG